MEGGTQPKYKDYLIKRNYDIEDIIKLELKVIQDPATAKQVRELASDFSPTPDGLKKLYHHILDNIKYTADGSKQIIQEPSRLLAGEIGDCKSLTVLICAVLQNYGLKYIVRFAWYKDQDYGHVYPIAIMPNGSQIILDVVWRRFNQEKLPILNKRDFKMEGLYRVAGANIVNGLMEYEDVLKIITADISDSVLDNDITKLTKGEFNRQLKIDEFTAKGEATGNQRYHDAVKQLQQGQMLSGTCNCQTDDYKLRQMLHATNAQRMPAYRMPILYTEPHAIAGVPHIGNAVSEAVKKVVNWLFKEALVKAAPFFLYTFVTKSAGKKIDAKRQKQQAILDFVAKTAGLDMAQIKSTLRTAIVKKYGKDPEALLNELAGGKKKVAGARVGSLVAIISAVSTVITVIVDIIKKIGSLFKKKKEEVPTEVKGATMETDDFKELERDMEGQGAVPIADKKTQTIPSADDWSKGKPVIDTTSKPTANKTNDNQMLIYGGIALAVWYVVFLK
jgi:hypothetical protein